MFIAKLRQIESSSVRSDMFNVYYIPLLKELDTFIDAPCYKHHAPDGA
jgi:hypothetical protein